MVGKLIGAEAKAVEAHRKYDSLVLGMQISNISFTLLLRDAVSLVLKDEGVTLPFPQAKTATCI